MDIAAELADYLETSGFGTVGTDIFVAQIPDDQNGIYVSLTGGTLGNYIPMNETVLDIFVKNTSSSTAITTINNIKNHIHRMHTTQTTNAFIYSILVIGDVESLDRDLEYAKLYKITVSILNRDLGVIS